MPLAVPAEQGALSKQHTKQKLSQATAPHNSSPVSCRLLVQEDHVCLHVTELANHFQVGQSRARPWFHAFVIRRSCHSHTMPHTHNSFSRAAAGDDLDLDGPSALAVSSVARAQAKVEALKLLAESELVLSPLRPNSDAQQMIALGHEHLSANRAAEAQAAFEEALRLDPNSLNAFSAQKGTPQLEKRSGWDGSVFFCGFPSCSMCCVCAHGFT